MVAFGFPLQRRLAPLIALFAVTATFLSVSAARNYLLFHSLAEVFSIAIAAGVFMIAWNSRDYPRTGGLVCLGAGLVFTALIDVFHTLSYAGMGVFDTGSDYATKFWIAGRYLQVLTMVLFAASLSWTWEPPYRAVAAGFALLSLSLIASILHTDLFPTCFVDGEGVTRFKRISEYVICALFAAAGWVLHSRKRALDPDVFTLLIGSIVLTILSELSFTLYLRATGLFNLIGHLLKIAAFFLVYLALIAGQVRKRIDTIRQLEEARAALVRSEAELREANISKDRLYSIVAHDMRNPISGLRTLADLMVHRYDDLQDGERRRFCRLLYEGADQAAGLTESLLMWASSQTGRLASHPADFPVGEALSETLCLAQQAAERKGIAISVFIPPDLRAHADPEMSATVLRNLLSNAVKFTPRGGTIEVRACASEPDVHIAVVDSGVGIAPDRLQTIFDPGAARSTKGTDAEGGSALGLLLTRELVDKNGGRLWVESAPGRGSTFHFTLPRSPAAPA